MANVKVDLYLISEYELLLRKTDNSMFVEYVITVDTDSGIGYLLDGESRETIMESSDFGLAAKGICKETRENAFCVILEYLLLRARITVPEDSERREIIKQFAKRAAERML